MISNIFNGRLFCEIWIVPLKDKIAKRILGAFKKCITTHYIQTTLQTDKYAESKNSIVK